MTIDETLLKLETEPGYVDTRNCLVFWARPTPAVKSLIATIQQRLREVVPSMRTLPTMKWNSY